MAVAIAMESPLSDEVRLLISELNETLLALTPPEHCYHMTAEEMAGPETPSSSRATTAGRSPVARSAVMAGAWAK